LEGCGEGHKKKGDQKRFAKTKASKKKYRRSGNTEVRGGGGEKMGGKPVRRLEERKKNLVR